MKANLHAVRNILSTYFPKAKRNTFFFFFPKCIYTASKNHHCIIKLAVQDV